MNSDAVWRRGRVCASALTAGALAMGLLAGPMAAPAIALPQPAIRQVDVETVVASAVLGSATPESVPAGVTGEVPSAAATSLDDPFGGITTALETIGRAAVDVVGLVLAPLWYLAAPVTFFVAAAYVNSSAPPPTGPDMSGITGMLHSLQYIVVWVGFPLRASSYLFPKPATAPPPSAAAEARRSATPEMSPDARDAAIAVGEGAAEDTRITRQERSRVTRPRRMPWSDPDSAQSNRRSAAPAADSQLRPRPSQASSAPTAGTGSRDRSPAPARASRSR